MERSMRIDPQISIAIFLPLYDMLYRGLEIIYILQGPQLMPYDSLAHEGIDMIVHSFTQYYKL